MAGPDKHSRTEQPTGKRLSEAKKKGSVPRSPDLTSSVMLLVGLISIYALGNGMVSTLKGACSSWWQGVGTYQLTAANVYPLMLNSMLVLALVLVPLFAILLASGIVVNHVQEPLSISWERITLSFDKINPVNGFGRLFSKDSLVEAVKSTFKIILIGYVAYRVLRDEITNVLFLVDGDLFSIMNYLTHIIFKIVLNCCGTLLVLSVIDLMYVKWRFIENLKMTKEEVKEENKQSEGDPKVKSKIRQLQYAQARRRMRMIIPTADVVITNPTHYAVALKYDRQKMAAPVVLLKGVDFMAQQIKILAKEHAITIVENRFLARELYSDTEEGKEIPEKLYAAVAEVLAYVYGLKGKA